MTSHSTSRDRLSAVRNLIDLNDSVFNQVCKVIALSDLSTRARLSQVDTAHKLMVNAVPGHCDCVLVLVPPSKPPNRRRLPHIQTATAMRVMRQGDSFSTEPFTLKSLPLNEACHMDCFLEKARNDVVLFAYLPILRFLEQERIRSFIMIPDSGMTRQRIERRSPTSDERLEPSGPIKFIISINKSSDNTWSIKIMKGEEEGDRIITNCQIEFTPDGDHAHGCCLQDIPPHHVEINEDAINAWVATLANNPAGLRVALAYASSTGGVPAGLLHADMKAFLHPDVGGHFLNAALEEPHAPPELPPTVRKQEPYSYEKNTQKEADAKRKRETNEHGRKKARQELEKTHKVGVDNLLAGTGINTHR